MDALILSMIDGGIVSQDKLIGDAFNEACRDGSMVVRRHHGVTDRAGLGGSENCGRGGVIV
jgi:hypothetical protein